MIVYPWQVDVAAFWLFAKQAETYDLPAAAARVEWDADPDLREFWRDQVRTAFNAVGIRTPALEPGMEPKDAR